MPTKKVTFAAIMGAIVSIALWVVKVVWKLEVPGEVAAAITTVLGFTVSYFTPHSKPKT